MGKINFNPLKRNRVSGAEGKLLRRFDAKAQPEHASFIAKFSQPEKNRAGASRQAFTEAKVASACLSQDEKKKEKEAAALSCEVQRTFETSDGRAGGEESQAFLGRYGPPRTALALEMRERVCQFESLQA